MIRILSATCSIFFGFAIFALGGTQLGFSPGTFEKLVLGKATISGALQSLGKPLDQFVDKSSGTTWLYYQNIGRVPGRVEIAGNTKSNLIQLIDIYPDDLTLADAKKLFGSGYKVIRYDFEPCLNNGGDSPLYESASGQLEYLVYEAKGIAMLITNSRISDIRYLLAPLGSKKSRCAGKAISK